MVPEINLLPKVTRKSAKLKWISFILAFVFCLLLVILVVQYISVTNSIKELESERQLLSTQKVELDNEFAILNEPKGIDLEASVAFTERISYPVSPLIIEINKYLESNAYLREYSFSEETVAFTVDFETISEVAWYVEDLMSSPYVKDVIVNEMETFDPTARDTENRFEVNDRYSNTIEVLIDLEYLRGVGGV